MPNDMWQQRMQSALKRPTITRCYPRRKNASSAALKMLKHYRCFRDYDPSSERLLWTCNR